MADMTVHRDYANKIAEFEQYNKDTNEQGFPVGDPALVIQTEPIKEAYDQLFPVGEKKEWVAIRPPEGHYQQRLSLFDSSSSETSKHDLDIVINIEPKNNNEIKEKSIMENYCQLNLGLVEDYEDIRGRLKEFIKA